MSKKLLSSSSSAAMELAMELDQCTEAAVRFYPPNAVFVKAVPRGSFPDIESQHPKELLFTVIDPNGAIVASLLSPNYAAVFLHVVNERGETPFYTH